MSKAKYFTIRLNEKLQKDFKEYCKKKGFSVATVIRLFIKEAYHSDELPFPIDDVKEYQNGNFDKRMALYFEPDQSDMLNEICSKYGVAQGLVLRAFMEYSISNNYFPDAKCEKNKNIEMLKNDIERLSVRCSYEQMLEVLSLLGYKDKVENDKISFIALDGSVIKSNEIDEKFETKFDLKEFVENK